jgi:hypothetical protein
MLNEAKMNSKCAYHIKRTAVISKLGLNEDDTMPSPISKTITIDLADTVDTRRHDSDAIVDQTATSGDAPDAPDAGSDNEASESGSQGSDSSNAKSEEDPLDDIFGDSETAKPKPRAKATSKGRGKKTNPEQDSEATPGEPLKGKGKGRGRGKKTNPEESVSEPPLQKRRRVTKTREPVSDQDALAETFA